MSDVTESVASAIEEIRTTFEGCDLETRPDGSGGAIVVLKDIPLGDPYLQVKVWFGFHISFQYPYADVYPHFTVADLSRADGSQLGEGFGSATFEGRPAVQISRRSNRLNPETDTAALKLLKVMKWMTEQR